MKTAYLIRFGAYGDHVHMSNVIRALDQLGYHITMEYNLKGHQIHCHNPRVSQRVWHEPHIAQMKGATPKIIHDWAGPPGPFARRLRDLRDRYDLVVSFQYSLERALIADEKTPEYFWPLHMRRRKNAGICYYDQSMKWAGLTDPKFQGWRGEIWFTRAEHEFMREWLSPWKRTFMILYAWRGTMQQKATYPMVAEVCQEWLRRHPNTTVFTTGDKECQKWEDGLQRDQVVHRAGRMPFRQAALMSRYMDLVVTPETGLGIVAGAYGTPKIMLLTAASLKNIVGNDRNDYSLQSPAWCSPCTRAIYNVNNCLTYQRNGETHPVCVDFPVEAVLDRMEMAKAAKHDRNWGGGENDEEVWV